VKTDQLIAFLASSAAPVSPRGGKRFPAWMAVAAMASFAAMLVTVGPRPDWQSAIGQPMLWMKLAFPASLAMASFVALRRLGHPGMRLGAAPLALAVPLVAMWLVAGPMLLNASASARHDLVMGSSSWQCLVGIALLSIPALVLGFFAVNRLAPTRLALSGAVAGLFAGSAGAFAYALYCPEMQPPFLAVWYALGMLVPAGVGAWLGPRWLRW
jgi:hypothetical protein